jgi:Astacin (Peptidase family M12A)
MFVKMNFFLIIALMFSCRGEEENSSKFLKENNYQEGFIDTHFGAAKIKYKVENNVGIFSGDIALPINEIKNSKDDFSKENSFNLSSSTAKKWPNGKIYYTTDSNFKGSGTNGETFFKNALEQAISTWENAVGLEFIPRTNQSNYIKFSTTPIGTSTTACGVSYYGMVGGEQNLYVNASHSETSTANCDIKRTLVHEMGHALGFLHEHQRPDRDIYLDLSETVSSANDYFKFETNNVLLNVPYNVLSIMHYFSGQAINPTTKKSGLLRADKINSGTINRANSLHPIDVEMAKKFYFGNVETVNPFFHGAVWINFGNTNQIALDCWGQRDFYIAGPQEFESNPILKKKHDKLCTAVPKAMVSGNKIFSKKPTSLNTKTDLELESNMSSVSLFDELGNEARLNFLRYFESESIKNTKEIVYKSDIIQYEKSSATIINQEVE